MAWFALLDMNDPRGEESPVDRTAAPTPERHYAPRPTSRPHNVDAADRMVRRQAAAWAGLIGLIGIPISFLIAEKIGADPPLRHLFWLGGPVAALLVYRLATSLTEGSAAIMARIHNPRGDTTPPVKEYSKPQALAAQGRFREAIEMYEDTVAAYPEDPEPYIRIARLCRDHLGKYEEAIRWFKRARAEARIDPGREMLVSREIIEIYRRKLGAPAMAIPELARLIERFPGHPSTESAQSELAELRRDQWTRPES